MRPRALTELSLKGFIREARTTGKRLDLRDSACRGLELRVSKSRVTWRLYYTDRRTHKRERLNLGYYPAIGLAEARRRAMAEKAMIEDPQVRASPAKDKRERATSVTFRELVQQRLTAQGDGALAEGSAELYRRTLDRHAMGEIGDIPACEVTKGDVARLVDSVAMKGKLVTADKLRIAISSVFAHGMKNGLLSQNPAVGVARRSSGLPRVRVPDTDTLRVLLDAIQTASLSADMRSVLQLIFLTGARSSEARTMARSDLYWDGYAGYSGPVWVVPGDKMLRGARVRGRSKGGRPIVKPLSKQAAVLLKQAVRRAGDREGLFSIARHIQVSKAMARICERCGLASDPVTPHDARRAISTWLGDRGERPDVVDAILGHSPRTLSGQVYNLSLLLPLVANALQRWGDHLESLTEPISQCSEKSSGKS